MGPLTPQEAAEAVLEGLAGQTRRFSIVGRPGSGKSSTLDAVGKALASEKTRYVRVGLSHDQDAPFAALVQLASQLSVDLLCDVCNPKVPWRAKLDSVTQALTDASPVVLFDEPRSPGSRLGRGVFADCAHELSQAILAIDGLRVVAGELPSTTLQASSHTVVAVRPASLPRHVLGRAWSSRTLAAAAERLMKEDAVRLALYSPLELRLAVAAVARGATPRELVAKRWSPPDLVQRALDTEAIRVAVAELGLYRMGAPLEVVRDRYSEDGLDAFLTDVVFIESPTGAIVHDVIIQEAHQQRWLPEPRSERAHAEVAAWHKSRFDAASKASDVVGATQHEMEVIHHLTESRDAAAVLSASVFFSEQYDLLGKEMSLAKRYDDAVLAYERALEHEPNDAYAHHYLAFNLDAQGKQPSRVKACYERARELRPYRARYHGRYATFLVTVGRMSEAQDAWAQALSQLAYDESLDPGLLVQQIYAPLAALLLHRGELDFADQVLSAFPRAFKDRATYRALTLRLELLREVEDETNVFPPALDREQRWKRPALLPSEDPRRVVRYHPGRICSVSERGIRILVGERLAETPPMYRYVDLSTAELVALGADRRTGFPLAVGTFVEHVALEGGTELLLHWQPQANALPPLELGFAPDRYIRAATSARP